MRRSILTALLLGAFCALGTASAQAQGSIQTNLRRNVESLADRSFNLRYGEPGPKSTTGRFVTDELSLAGVHPVHVKCLCQRFVPTVGAESRDFFNAIGILQGKDRRAANQYILVTAVFEGLGRSEKSFPGASHDAPGVATLIELARYLSLHRDQLQRSVMFVVFDREADRQIGVEYFLRSNGAGHFRHRSGLPDNVITEVLHIGNAEVGWQLHDIFADAGIEFVNYEPTLSLSNPRKPDNAAFEELGVMVRDLADIVIRSATAPVRGEAQAVTYMSPPPFSANLIPPTPTITVNGRRVRSAMGNVTVIDGRPTRIRSKVYRVGEPPVAFGASVYGGTHRHHYTRGTLRGKHSGMFGAGVWSQIRIHGALAVKPEVAYEMTYARHPQGRINTHGLVVPLNLVLTSPREMPFGMDLTLGGYFRHSFGGRQDGAKLDFDERYHRNEAGLSWGLGMWMHRVRVGFTDRYELTNFTRRPLAGNAHIRNRASYWTVSYRF